ncbi:RNA polymerase sigma factor [Amycolatopsis sp. NPDC004079]|uniref:RNA polymerase sigma factor n=1 Tax=Amycolatopsis sp. NPDC004079 TaxID=3154549 RepID=UPI00339EBD35
MTPRPKVQPDPRLRLLELYDEALPEVYGYLFSRCGARALAEDLTAETFLAAVNGTQLEIPPVITVGWLIGIARHKLVDHWRRQERERRGLQVLGGRREEPEDPWDERLDAMVVREVLENLEPHYRAALTLRYLDGLPVPQVAEYLGRGVRSAEGLLVRARTAFRLAYQERGEAR